MFVEVVDFGDFLSIDELKDELWIYEDEYQDQDELESIEKMQEILFLADFFEELLS